MTNLSFRPIAVALGILFLTAVPTKAGPVVVSEVVQILRSYQNPPDLRIRSVSQISMAVSSRLNSTGSGKVMNGLSGAARDGASAIENSLLGTIVLPNDQNMSVDIIDVGDVEGTVCDCGEIFVKGGVPLWPLLFVAAVPFFFIHDDCEDCERSTPTPTPPSPLPSPTVFCVNCTPSEVPEPASLILLGSGLATLGAGLRRRYVKAKLTSQIKVAEEGLDR